MWTRQLGTKLRGLFSLTFFRHRGFLLLIGFSVVLVVVALVASMLPAGAGARLPLFITAVETAAYAILALVIVLLISQVLPRDATSRRGQLLFSKPLSSLTHITGLLGSFVIFIILFLLIATVVICGSVLLFSHSCGESITARSFLAPESSQMVSDGKNCCEAGKVNWLNSADAEFTVTFTGLGDRNRDAPLVVRILPLIATVRQTEAKLRVIDTESGRFQTKRIELLDNVPTYVEMLPAFTDAAELRVTITNLPESDTFGLFSSGEGYRTGGGVMLVVQESSFIHNLLRHNIIAAGKLSLLAAIGMFCGTFLSEIVSAALALFLLLLSHIVPFIHHIAAQIGAPISCHHCVPHAPHEPTPGFLENIMKWVFESLATVLPDMQRHSSKLQLVSGELIPAAQVIDSLLYCLFYLVIFVVVASLILGRRQL